MNVVVTGANGFIAKNLIAELEKEEVQVLKVYRETSMETLEKYCETADFIYHLAGENRPETNDEFYEGNAGFTNRLINLLHECGNYIPVMYASTIQAEFDNDYGRSKRQAEEILQKYNYETEAAIYIYRFPNVFGKWCRPNYNSVVATFCHNIAHDLPIQVNAPEKELTLVYIDDILGELKSLIENTQGLEDNQFQHVTPVHQITLQQLADTIKSFKENRSNLQLPNVGDTLEKKLYSTYLTYLPEDDFSYNLKMNIDHRGSFTEVLKTLNNGQVSVNVSKPGITKGNHWHHTKNEKFLVVSGKGVIRFRKLYSDEVIEYEVSEEKFEVVDIPPGYTHNIENTGDKDMVTIMWANELFDPDHPDTNFLEV
ncbi:NAD-dependent epimerase/dehydratase family protein [Salimicrobium sp. PL1-032A]|uniref:polysaccharide biosynthesis C-terminal domain-containing protein n=1 Tax=Salimicrobium sp. PL1-032A TaxID=3095364 RepID=UPI003260BCEB